MRRVQPRGLAVVALVVLMAAIAGSRPGPAVASDGLVVTSATRYDVRPDERVVAVTIDAVATNVTPDDAAGSYYYTGMTLPVHANATDISASSGGFALQTTIVEQTQEYQAVEVLFATEVNYGQQYGFRVSYRLSDALSESGGDTVVRQSFVAFPVWAFGSPEATNASVEVAWPDGYNTEVMFGSMRRTLDAGGPRLSAAGITDPTSFFAYVTGERDVARARAEFSVPMSNGDARVLMLAWPDDPDWLERQSAFLRVGLPALEQTIGLEYPVEGTLSVSEHAYRHLGTYAGVFNPAVATILLRYDADAFVALHEAAHAWFNGTLFDERWINEAFASYYAAEVATALELPFEPVELTPEIADVAFPLAEWLDSGFEDQEREAYAYAATPALAAEIAELAGAEGLETVWVAARDGRLAYDAGSGDLRRAGDPEPAGWQRLLDLLEEETAADFDPIWREWVVSGTQAALLDERAAVRASYDALEEAAGDWQLPRSTRVLMDAWDFDAVADELEEIDGILDESTRLSASAEELGLDATQQLREVLEDRGIDAAQDEVAEQAAAITAIGAAEARLRGPFDAIETVGLIGEPAPASALGRARTAFEQGNDALAIESAGDAVEARDAASERGRLRLGAVVGLLLLVDVIAVAAFAVRRFRYRTTLTA